MKLRTSQQLSFCADQWESITAVIHFKIFFKTTFHALLLCIHISGIHCKILDSKWDFDVVIFFHQLVLIPFFTIIGFLAIFHLNLMVDWLIEWRNRIVCVDWTHWTEERQILFIVKEVHYSWKSGHSAK